MIQKLLIANRGEIACRIIRTCREMGIGTVAVFSDPDAHARHVRMADEAVRLSGATPVAVYLNIAAILEAARRTGADAIHPGYGFLAENAEFAVACREVGLTFVGPAPNVIERMGSKREARQLVAAAGVPVVPGYDGPDQSDAALLAEIARIGYPVMVKASAGGGGRGMRLVTSAADAPESLASARHEAQAAFGDDTLLLERAIERPRHIEFQIFGDEHGQIVHLGERECSIQRRHQKLIEETPAPGLSDDLRARMAEAALTVGRLLDYTNAGTVEFIVAPDGAFYFLEVNTRLQVEHPITELVTGFDLVRWQIEIAEGKTLPLTQAQIQSGGHAIEARLCAEEPDRDFRPATGQLVLWRPPDIARVDAGVQTSDDITANFDSLIAKLSVHAPTREEAVRRLARALDQTTALGVHTNAQFLARALRHPAFLAGATTTAFIADHAVELFAPSTSQPGETNSLEIAALFAALARLRATTLQSSAQHFPPQWRNNPVRPYMERFTLAGSDISYNVSLTPIGSAQFNATVARTTVTWRGSVLLHEATDQRMSAEVDGRRFSAWVASGASATTWVALSGQTWEFTWQDPLVARAPSSQVAGSLLAPMPGVVRAVLVAVGQEVHAGDPLMTIEAMKMEQTIRAPHAGAITTIYFGPGDQVAASASLIVLTAPQEQ
jgi:acetyl/propionyl-CoA carboxylase alpha subunit